tara:strand:- start:228 stop:722 length:495 start_codon:yes stop_codon:yes gene_type:complete
MERKKGNMERYKMVNTNDILKSDFNVVKHKSIMNNYMQKFIDKFGCIKMLIVCEYDNKFKIIDGNKAYDNYLKNNINKILCYNLGQLTYDKEIAYRLLLNVHFKRLNYINIAKYINDICDNEIKMQSFSNNSGLPIKDVKRYKDLLNFNWDDFLKDDNKQINLF